MPIRRLYIVGKVENGRGFFAASDQTNEFLQFKCFCIVILLVGNRRLGMDFHDCQLEAWPKGALQVAYLRVSATKVWHMVVLYSIWY